ncbi:hypothetical protein G7Y89_g6404 [Cudoniella acicularis]|uniref:Uncharacterized protein n=1 Tax=Cudoniella acicularis TaxID=354080 RepID=A0A8H4RM06_9HELO|nr:hypothetical protein G7Y89_g6404 [Cudoniella acicularis]
MGKFIGDREIQRTAAWQPPVVEPKPAKLMNVNHIITPRLQDMKLAQPLEETTPLPLFSMAKPKTRGEANPSKESRPVETIIEIPDDATPTPVENSHCQRKLTR